MILTVGKLLGAGGGVSLTGLVGYWKLDEATGATRVDSVGSNDMADFFTVTQETGILTNAAGFDASNTEYLFHASADELHFGDGDWSWTLWYKPLDTITQIMVGKDDTTTNREGFIGAQSGVTVFCTVYYGSEPTDLFSVNLASSLSISSWGFIVAWHDSSARTLNIQVDNGTIDSTDTSSQTLASTTAGLYFGRRGLAATPRYCTGHLDAVGKWNRVLTAAERTTLYNGGVGLDYPF